MSAPQLSALRDDSNAVNNVKLCLLIQEIFTVYLIEYIGLTTALEMSGEKYHVYSVCRKSRTPES